MKGKKERLRSLFGKRTFCHALIARANHYALNEIWKGREGGGTLLSIRSEDSEDEGPECEDPKYEDPKCEDPKCEDPKYEDPKCEVLKIPSMKIQSMSIRVWMSRFEDEDCKAL